jgi:hypothetical protein
MTHVPPTQNSGVVAFLQRLWLATHAQAPFEQTGVSPEHVVSFCQVRCALHDCGVEPLQRRSPRLHSTHWPPKQIGELPEQAPAARFCHCPDVLQNWGVAWLHCVGVPFGVQTPVHAVPMHVLLPAHAEAAPHCPFVVHVWSW